MMDKKRENRISAITGHSETESHKIPFRRILHFEKSNGFLSDLRNPGLWNDFVVEMVRLS